jgi:hypothetical protein
MQKIPKTQSPGLGIRLSVRSVNGASPFNSFGKGGLQAVPLPFIKRAGFSPEALAACLKTIYQTSSSP